MATWLLGVLLKSVGKKRIERAFQGAMERIPLVNMHYGPVPQVVDVLQRDPTDKLQGMKVVYGAFGGEAGCWPQIMSTDSMAKRARSLRMRRLIAMTTSHETEMP